MNRLSTFFSGLFLIGATVLSAQLKTISVKTLAATDDIEETRSSGSINTSSTSLQLGDIAQLVGVRFPSVSIPVGATVTKAYIQFSTRYTNAKNATVNIVAQKGNAAAFTSTARSLSSRPFTSAQVTWATQPWTVSNERTTKQRTPDISLLVNEALSSGWTGSGALAFKLWANLAGEATAIAHSSTTANNPELVIEYVETPITRTALSGVFINEVSGSGSITLKNDWIEVYNSNVTAVNLDSVFLSDGKKNPYKFMFKNVVLPAKGFLVIEADDTLSVSTNTKAAFGISSSGETVFLNQVFNGVLRQLDSLNVPISQFNTSFGRQIDGSNTLVSFNTPTPSVSTDNLYRFAMYRTGSKTPQYSDVVTLDFSHLIDYTVYPNPTTEYVDININQSKIDNATIRVVSLYGQVVLQQQISNATTTIHLELDKLNAGQYIIFMDIKGKRSIAKKLTITK